jgi:hypothetical protein
MFTPLKNKKVVNTKTNKRKVGGVVVGIDVEKELEDLKKLLFKIYPENAKHISLKTIKKLNLNNINDLMSLTPEQISKYIEDFDIEDMPYQPYQESIKNILIYLSRKLNAELSNLKDKLNEKFPVNITNKIIDNLGISNVNDLIYARQNDIRSFQMEGSTESTIRFTKAQIDLLLLLQKELQNRQTKLKAKLAEMFSKKVSNRIINELKLTDVYDLCNKKDEDMIYIINELKDINDAEMKIRIFGLPRKLLNEQRILIDELGRFFEIIIKKIIRELMLFDISDLMYATVIDIENLNQSIPEITERNKEKLLELRSLEFKKYLRRKLFKDDGSNITEKDFYIDKIILKISDVYALMNASNDKIDELHLGNLKNAKNILKKLRDILKANSSNTNSSNTNSSNTNSVVG